MIDLKLSARDRRLGDARGHLERRATVLLQRDHERRHGLPALDRAPLHFGHHDGAQRPEHDVRVGDGAVVVLGQRVHVVAGPLRA